MIKITRHFVYVCSKRVVSRTYGGCDYTLQVYEIKAKGKLVHIGEIKRCTRGHKGEESEAWTVVAEKFPKLGKALTEKSGHNGYWSWRDGEELGIKLQNLGGA